MPKATALAAALFALALSSAALGLELARSGRNHELTRRLDELARELAALANAPRPAPVDAAPSNLAELESRVANLERAAERRPLAGAVAPVPAAAPARGSAEEKSPAPSSAERAEFEDLLARLIGSDYDLHGPDEEIQRFFELARGTGFLEEHLRALEERVAAYPGDLEARMDLAGAYVAKIMTMPHGPEQGVWGSKAEEQWRAVSERDSEHWAAHFALGNNFSFYPDVMGKTGEALRYLERARAIQEELAPAPEHVRTYLSLARLYLRDGRKTEARSTLEAGLRFHPGNEELLAELARIGEG